VFKDGALKCNNPTSIADSEWRSIWRSGNSSLDLHLSIGTGIDQGHFTKSPNKTDRKPDPVQPIIRPRSKTGLEEAYYIARDAVESTMDSESQYRLFRQGLHGRETRKRYRRFNVCINDGQPRPSLDDHKQIPRLKTLAENHCQSKETRWQLGDVARVLISSNFYFEKRKWGRSSGQWVCQGIIHWRLLAERAKALSKLLEKKLSFLVRTEKPPSAGGEPEWEKVTVVPATFTSWPLQLEFEVPEAAKDRRICIDVIFPDGFRCAISGFPRTIA
jgi:hypothetical protein